MYAKNVTEGDKFKEHFQSSSGGTKGKPSGNMRELKLLPKPCCFVSTAIQSTGSYDSKGFLWKINPSTVS